jgi:hypothetical protein
MRLCCTDALTPNLFMLREWVQALWQWLAQPAHRPDWPVVARSGWPVLPTAGGRLVPLAPDPSSAAAVLPGGDWPEGLQAVLVRLGVAVVDTASFELPVDALVSAGLAHPGSGAGVALALAAALGGGRHLETRTVEELGAAERRLLRSYLLQPVWFQARGGVGGSAACGDAAAAAVAALAGIVRQLPLFELANDGSFLAGPAADDEQSQDEQQAETSNHGDGVPREQGSADAGGSANFVPLQEGCALAPQGGCFVGFERMGQKGSTRWGAVPHLLAHCVLV